MGLLIKKTSMLLCKSIFPGVIAELEVRRDDEIYAHKTYVRRGIGVIQSIIPIIGGTIPLSIDDRYQLIAKKASDVADATGSRLLLLDQDESILRLYGTNGLGGMKASTVPLRGFAGWVAQKGRPLLLSDIFQDPRLDLPYDQLNGYTRALLSAPMK